VRLDNGDHLLVETKGLADLDVPHKDERAIRWAVDATVATGVRWTYLRVDEEPFRRHEASLTTARGLVDLVYSLRRERALSELASPAEPRTREQILNDMENVSKQLRGVEGLDETLRQVREELGE
jgi:hypothetical protein